MKAINIKWVKDGCDIDLPEEFIIPASYINKDGEIDYDAISDLLSDSTGYLHEGFELVQEYLLGADNDDLKELSNHLSMNGYHSKIEDKILLALEHEYKEIETILEDRDILFVIRGPIRQIDITKEDVRYCDELFVENEAIDATYELWFDVDEYFGWQTAELDSVWINFYTDWHPDGRITASYTVEGDNLYFHDEWKLTPEEVEFFRKKMEKFCQESYGKSLEKLWTEKTVEDDVGDSDCTKVYKVRLEHSVELFIRADSEEAAQEWINCHTPNEAKKMAEANGKYITEDYSESIICECRGDSVADVEI